MDIRTALRQGTELLERGAITAPRLTAEVLLSHATGREKSWLYGHPEEQLTQVAWLHYGRYLYQRLHGKPTQYITKQQEFYGRPFRVTPAVLIPRPETEHVVETALRLAAGARRILDIGCGSGAIAVTLQLELRAAVWATDISTAALTVAADNNRRLGAAVQFAACDLASAFAPRSFDVVVSNPPYIPEPEAPALQREIRDHEPTVALFGGPTGVEIYERLIAEATCVLRPSGRVILEIGYQGEARIREMLAGPWRDLEAVHDLAGLPRVLTAVYSP
jgi:release factor glutamine methyltransferase